MALSLTWYEWHGSDTPGTAVGELAANLNFGSADTIDITPADSKILRTDGFSYFKQGMFNFSGSMTQVDNVRVHKSAGVYKTEETLEFSGGITVSVPDETDQTWETIGTSLPGSANVILPNTTDGILLQADSISSPGYTSGSRSGVVGFQLAVTANTETGAVNEKTVTITWDEA